MPPADLALPTHGLRKHIQEVLNAWKQEVLAQFEQQATTSRAARKARHDFKKHLVAYSEWFWKSLSNHRALHHDVYLALVSPDLSSKPASADRDLLQLATDFSDFVCKPLRRLSTATKPSLLIDPT